MSSEIVPARGINYQKLGFNNCEPDKLKVDIRAGEQAREAGNDSNVTLEDIGGYALGIISSPLMVVAGCSRAEKENIYPEDFGLLTKTLYKGMGWKDKNKNSKAEVKEVRKEYRAADKNNDGIIQKNEAWDYYFANYQGLIEITKLLEHEAQFEYPLKTDKEMENYVKNIVAGKEDEKQKFQAIYDAIIFDLKVEPNVDPLLRPNGAQTALGVFYGLNGERFANCQEYSILFITMARIAGLKAYFIEVRRGQDGERVWHSCAQVILDSKTCLVDFMAIAPRLNYLEYHVLDDQHAIAWHYYNEGAIFMEHKRFLEAKEALLTAIEIAPDLAAPYRNLGTIYFLENNRDKAEKYWLRTVELDSTDVEVLASLGQLYIGKGDTSQAEEYFLEVLEIDSSQVGANNNLGIIYTDQGKFGEAEKQLLRAIGTDPRCAAAYINLGRLYSLQGELDKAEKNFLEAIAINPNLASAYNNLEEIYRLQGKNKKAQDLFIRAREFIPSTNSKGK